MRQRVAVLVSGGVDSAVALRLLAERQDLEVRAFYLKIWLEDELAFLGSCPWEEDLRLVREVCSEVRVPLEIVSLQHSYHEQVVGYVLDELRAGRTPSPDVLCNSMIKFGAFLDRIGPGFDRIASGHYARLGQRGERTRLLRGVDPVKDQTYFLCRLTQEQVGRCIFPIGDLRKDEVRCLARRWGLVNAERPDSQGICFLGQIPFDEFVHHHLGEQPGDIVELDSGKVLGSHHGVWFHTIGQRRGLGLAGGPWYVAGKDVAENRIFVVHGLALENHHRRDFVVADPHWICSPPGSDRLTVRLRHGERLWPARVEIGDAVRVHLYDGDPGIAPGQFCVFYDDEECLGGGPVA